MNTSEIYMDVSDGFVTPLSTNSTDPGHSFGSLNVSPITVLMLLLATWIVLTNGVVVVCLVTSRKALKSHVNIQLLSLSVTDLFVGFCVIPASLTPISASFSKYEACAVVIYLYLVSQSATLYHTLLIGIHRLLTIRKKSTTNQLNRFSLKLLLSQIMLIWLGCMTFIAVPFLVLAQYEENAFFCSAPNLFGSNYTTATMFTITLLNLPPLLCVNVIYGYLLLYLRKRLKTVSADKRIASHQSDTNVPRPSNNETDSLEPTRSDVKGTSILSVYNIGEEPGSYHGYKDNAVKKYMSEETQSFELQTTQDIKSDVSGNKALPICNKNFKLKQRGMEMSTRQDGLEKQRRVFITFGLFLFWLNVFMIPFCVFSIIDNINVGFLSFQARLLFLSMAMCNSALNPVIHFFRIKPFQNILKEKVMKLFDIHRLQG